MREVRIVFDHQAPNSVGLRLDKCEAKLLKPDQSSTYTCPTTHCRAFMESNYQEIKDLNPNFNFLVRPHPEVPSTIVAQYGLFGFFCHLLSWLYIVARRSGVRWFDMGVLVSNIGMGSWSISMAATSGILPCLSYNANNSRYPFYVILTLDVHDMQIILIRVIRMTPNPILPEVGN